MQVIWSGPARAGLRPIDDWLPQNASAEVAVRILAAIRFRADILVDFPRSGRPYGDDHRVLLVQQTSYLIRYRIARGTVEVLRVHHERQVGQLEP
jgi:plasmid stabilization system protein ParE